MIYLKFLAFIALLFAGLMLAEVLAANSSWLTALITSLVLTFIIAGIVKEMNR